MHACLVLRKLKPKAFASSYKSVKPKPLNVHSRAVRKTYFANQNHGTNINFIFFVISRFLISRLYSLFHDQNKFFENSSQNLDSIFFDLCFKIYRNFPGSVQVMRAHSGDRNMEWV